MYEKISDGRGQPTYEYQCQQILWRNLKNLSDVLKYSFAIICTKKKTDYVDMAKNNANKIAHVLNC